MRSTLLVLVYLFLLSISPSAAGEPMVMVVNSYHQGFFWLESHNAALRAGLEGKARLTFYYLDTKRIPPSEYQSRADKVWEEIVRQAPDLVVLTDDNAVSLLGSLVWDRDIPIVFLGVNENPRKYFGSMDKVTGVLERPLYKRSLLFLHDIMGSSLERCLVLSDSGETSRVIQNIVSKDRQSLFLGNIYVAVRLVGTFGQWKDEVRSARDRKYDAVLVGLYHSLIDEKGKHVASEEVMAWTSANAQVPVFGYWDFSVGKGKAVGGLVNSGTFQGEAAAELVLKILSGQAPSTLFPVTPKDGQFLFSRYELDRWEITLPESITRGTTPIRFVE